ncbi:MAG: Gfo/Idh/MocA family oxidoreductase, partial [Microthrixaceae bacterium]|nr:Gfo/Idh/MocA family oxidoreductase [Microthrixaceae bacterium]
MTLTIGVAGIDHLHLLELVQGLVDAGATTAAHVPDGELLGLYEGWRTDSVPTALPDLLADPAIDLVVTAGIPSERAEVAVAALQAGKHVLTAKPGVTTLADLDRVQAAAARAGRRWTVLFTERFTNRATSEAIRLARSGAVGEVIHLIGSGPHALNQEGRPAWFFEADRSGGILADLASHQVDQFLAVTDDLGAEVTHSFVGNVSCPEHPAFSDLGTLRLVGRTPAG